MISKKDIKSMTLQELTDEMNVLGEPKFRALQIYKWLHEKKVTSFEEMSNLSQSFKEKLEENYYIAKLKIVNKLSSKIDETKKYLFELFDGNCVETVLMKYNYAWSLCISTQVGCKMGCSFCASTLAGFVRNLTASEMLEEIYAVERDSNIKVGSLVLMGIGEPLDNFDNVMKFFEILSSLDGKNLSLRHVSLSTCGLVDRIYDLMDKKLGVTLSISLHASDNETRSKIMPVNKRYNLNELIVACKKYFEVTGRRITFEYALISGVNDSEDYAKKLANLLKGMTCHVNLIPVNPVKENSYKRGSKNSIENFRKMLEKLGVNATIRRELGSDISAACGQLRLAKVKGEN